MPASREQDDAHEVRLLSARRVPLAAEDRREVVALLAGLLLDAVEQGSSGAAGRVLPFPRRPRVSRDAA
jgi:hypothetical protein